jgi:hypothetical protein
MDARRWDTLVHIGRDYSRWLPRRWRVPLARAAVLLLALSFANCSVARTLDGTKPTRTAEPTIPVYPGARDVQLETFAIPNAGIGYVRTFSTTDAPAMVEAFYQRELEARGWRMVADNFYGETRACPLYQIRLRTERVAEGMAHMRLSWQPEACKKL